MIIESRSINFISHLVLGSFQPPIMERRCMVCLKSLNSIVLFRVNYEVAPLIDHILVLKSFTVL